MKETWKNPPALKILEIDKVLNFKFLINLDNALKEIIEFYENNLKEIRKLEIKYIDSNLTKN